MTTMAVIMVCLPYNTNCLPCIELFLIMKSSSELTEDDKGPSPPPPTVPWPHHTPHTNARALNRTDKYV